MNQFAEDGPSASMVWDSPTASDARERTQPAATLQRQWPQHTITSADGATTHDPLWFENPYVEAGAGRVDADPDGHTASGRDTYRLGGNDIFAATFGLPWFVVDMVFAPVSMAVDPIWELQESDSVAERRHFLGFEYDAAKATDQARVRDQNDIGPRTVSDGGVAGDPHAHFAGRFAPTRPTPSSSPSASLNSSPSSSLSPSPSSSVPIGAPPGPSTPMTPLR